MGKSLRAIQVQPRARSAKAARLQADKHQRVIQPHQRLIQPRLRKPNRQILLREPTGAPTLFAQGEQKLLLHSMRVLSLAGSAGKQSPHLRPGSAWGSMIGEAGFFWQV
jgi:hypothetical protein